MADLTRLLQLSSGVLTGLDAQTTNLKLDQVSLRDSGGDHFVTIDINEDNAADRILSLKLNDAARTIDLSGNLTVEATSVINQDLSSDASPTLGGLTLTGLSGVLKATAGVISGSADADDLSDGSTNAIVTLTQESNWDNHLSNNGSDHSYIDQDVTSGSAPTFTADNFSDGGSNAIITTTQETNFEAAYTHVSSNGTDHGYINQDVQSSASPTFAGLTVTNAITEFSTDGTMAGDSDSAVPTEKAVKTFVEANLAGLSWKDAVKASSTQDLTSESYGASGVTYANGSSGVGATLTQDDATDGVFGSLDGISISVNDRVLIMDQGTGAQNGIYELTTAGNGVDVAWVLTRVTDCDESAEIDSAAIFVQQGSTKADIGYTQTADSPTIGTTALTWVQFNGAANIVAGTGLTKSGNTINAIGGNGITANANDLAVDLDGSTLSVSASGLKLADLTDTYILVGNGSNVATGVAMSGDATITNAGVVSISLSGHDVTELDDVSDAGSGIIMSSGERSKLTGIEALADVTDATNVAAAGAVMDGDFSSNGLMRRTGAGTYDVITDSSTNWDAAYTHVSNNGSDHSYIDQDVTSGSAPTFTADNFSDGGSNAIITTTQETNFESAYTHVSSNGSDHTYINQDVTSSAAPSFAGIALTSDITTTGAAIDWDLKDNDASALSFDSAGKAGIINIITTDGSEGVTMSGTLAMGVGTSVNEFSTDTTLSGDSDDALVTEKAIKAYVDAQVAGADVLDKTVTIGETMGTDAEEHIIPVRYAKSGETAGRVYKANKDDIANCYAIGFVTLSEEKAAGETATMNFAGELDLGADDSAFNAADIGKPCYVSGSGAFSVTAPTTATEAVYRLGIVKTTTAIEIITQLNGVN